MLVCYEVSALRVVFRSIHTRTPTPVQNANLYSNVPDNTDSAYRESRSEEDSLPTDSDSSLGDVVGAAIGNVTTNVEEEDTRPKSKPNQPNPSTREEMGGAARAKDAIAFNIDELRHDPTALAAALVEMLHRGELGSDPQPAPGRSQRPRKQQRPRRMPPQALLNTKVRAVRYYPRHQNLPGLDADL